MRDARSEFTNAIRSTLGYGPDPTDVVVGKMTRFATSERRHDDAGWCRLFVNERAGVFGDHRTGVNTTWIMNRDSGVTAAERTRVGHVLPEARQARLAQQRAEQARHAANNDRLWSETLPVERGDPVALYLANRGIDLWPLPDCLRLHRGLPYYDDGHLIHVLSVMVADIVGSDGRRVALHRTFITDEGRKAPVPAPKKLTSASGALHGSFIPLGRPTAGVIGVAEGIETALAAHCASGVPVVAAYCAGNLAAWRWPAGTRRIVVFSDNDPVGRNAALSLKHRASFAEIAVIVLAPTEPGQDWCDVWSQRNDAAVERGGS